ncbi:MAG: uroporphyrinogen-III C-methyltransferase [Gammaproteobacteria bacterium]|nr:uroporphyrinogen-III C-methyltransferase [Gammaproteobacteria bacterium]
MENYDVEHNSSKWHRYLLAIVCVIVFAVALYYTRSYWLNPVRGLWQEKVATVQVATAPESLEQLQQQVQELQKQQAAMAAKLAGNDNQHWLLADAMYLTRLASDQLQVNHDPEMALKLLRMADQRVAVLTGSQYTPIRHVFAKDIIQLQLVPTVDVGGLIAKLIALSEQVGRLPLVQPTMPTPTPAAVAPATVTAASAENLPWWQKLWLKVKQELRSLVVVRHLDEPITPLLSVEQQSDVNQQLATLLQQAQWAVLHQNQQVYQISLTQAAVLVKRYYALNQQATKVVVQQLSDLQAVNIAPQMPDLTDALALLVTAQQNMEVKAIEADDKQQLAAATGTK